MVVLQLGIGTGWLGSDRVGSVRVRAEGRTWPLRLPKLLPPPTTTYPPMIRRENCSTVIYIVCPKLVFVFRVQAVFMTVHISPTNGFFISFVPGRFWWYYSFIKYNNAIRFGLYNRLNKLYSLGGERATIFYGSLYFTTDRLRTFNGERNTKKKQFSSFRLLRVG